MGSGLGSRLGSAAGVLGVAVALMAGSSAVAAAETNLGGTPECIHYDPATSNILTTCPGWKSQGANMENLNFNKAVLTNARLVEPNLKGTNFSGANLSGTFVNDPVTSSVTRLTGAIIDDHTSFSSGLVQDQTVKVTGVHRYFLLSDFKPKAFVQGVTIRSCRSDEAKDRSSLFKGDKGPGLLTGHTYKLDCLFSTTDDGPTGHTIVQVKVD